MQVSGEHPHVRVSLLERVHVIVKHRLGKFTIQRVRCHVIAVANLQDDLMEGLLLFSESILLIVPDLTVLVSTS